MVVLFPTGQAYLDFNFNGLQADIATASAASTNASNLTSGTVAAARGGAGTVSGILKANGAGLVSAAVSATDYAPATTGSAALKANGSGGFGAAAASDLSNGVQGSGAVVLASGPTLTAPIVAGILTTQGGGVRKVRVAIASGPVTVATTDDIVVVNKTVAAATAANLPATPTTGQTFVIKDGKGDAAANNITITPAAGTIDGAGTFVMATNYQAVTVTYTGSEWGTL